MSLRIDDVWHHQGFGREQRSLLFSHSDRRIGGTNLSRIDRFYVSDWLGARGSSVGIFAGTSMSDHAPVILTIANARRFEAHAVRIPESVQLDEELTESVEAVWADLQVGPGDWAGSLGRGLVGQSEMFREEVGRRSSYGKRAGAEASSERGRSNWPPC